MVFANEFIQSYGAIVILVLFALVAFLGYQVYRDRHSSGTGSKLRKNVIAVLRKNGCVVKGNDVVCTGAQFAGLGQTFTVDDAVDRVLEMISTEMGGSAAAAPAPSRPRPPPGPGHPPGPPGPRGPPPPMQTNPHAASMSQGPGMAQPPPPGPGFGGLLSADGEPLGGSMMAASDPMQAGMAPMYNPSVM